MGGAAQQPLLVQLLDGVLTAQEGSADDRSGGTSTLPNGTWLQLRFAHASSAAATADPTPGRARDVLEQRLIPLPCKFGIRFGESIAQMRKRLGITDATFDQHDRAANELAHLHQLVALARAREASVEPPPCRRKPMIVGRHESSQTADHETKADAGQDSATRTVTGKGLPVPDAD